MTLSPQCPNARASVFAGQRGLFITGQLGRGLHGSVHLTSAMTAVKAHKVYQSYRRECDCYNRLHERNITEICGHHVPQFLASDDELSVIEMTIVTPPFLLDFAGAYLDWPPEFSPEAMEYWLHEKQEQFGPRWKEVQNILVLCHAYKLGLTEGQAVVGAKRGGKCIGIYIDDERQSSRPPGPRPAGLAATAPSAASPRFKGSTDPVFTAASCIWSVCRQSTLICRRDRALAIL